MVRFLHTRSTLDPWTQRHPDDATGRLRGDLHHTYARTLKHGWVHAMKLTTDCDLMVEDEDHPALPKGHKTARVLRTLEQQSICSVLQIKQRTGLERRTVNAILYALQGRGLVAPVPTPAGMPENSGRCFGLVDGLTVKATPIVRQVPFRERNAAKPVPPVPKKKVFPRAGAVESLDWEIPDNVPTWFAPRLPPMHHLREHGRTASTAELFSAQ